MDQTKRAGWGAGYFAERVWIVGTNIAYAVMVFDVLRSWLVAVWAGWVERPEVRSHLTADGQIRRPYRQK